LPGVLAPEATRRVVPRRAGGRRLDGVGGG